MKFIALSREICPNVTSICWIPQADSIIHENIIRGLPQCDTFEKYICMLEALRRNTKLDIGQECIKPCKAETYKIRTSRSSVDAFTDVSTQKHSIGPFLAITSSCFILIHSRKEKYGGFMS